MLCKLFESSLDKLRRMRIHDAALQGGSWAIIYTPGWGKSASAYGKTLIGSLLTHA